MRKILMLVIIVSGLSLLFNNIERVSASPRTRAIAIWVPEYRYWSYATGKSTYHGQVLYTCPGGTYPIQSGEYYVDICFDDDNQAYDKYRLLYTCK